MKSILYALTRPVAYLRIDHPSKWIIDWALPAILAGLLLSIMVVFRPINFFGAGGLVSLLLGFVQSLPGFYIAALAAIAVFARVDIDRPMPPPTPTIQIKKGSRYNVIELTRRRFLCMLFAFLTLESFAIAAASAIAISIADGVKASVASDLHVLLRYGFMAAYFLFFCQMSIATLWSLYYLGEKIHQPDGVPALDRG